MDYREFCGYIKAHILEYMPEEFTQAEVRLDTVVKNNSVVKQGISIRTEDSNISPKVYLENFYRGYENGVPIETVCRDLVEEYRRHMVKDQMFDMKSVKDFNAAKEHLVTKVVSAKHNKMLLRERPSAKLDDLAVLYQINVGNFADGTTSILVTNEILRDWGVSVEELHQAAVENTERIRPSALSTIKAAMYGQDENFLAGDEYVSDGMLLVLTNSERNGGASAIANPEILTRVSDVIGGDYYVLPSSVHEVLILPKDVAKEMGITEKEMGQMVRDVNRAEVEKEEWLSDHIYEYNRDTKSLETVRDSREKSKEAER